MTNNLPKVTIVTVCYNAAESIQKTMESVLNQTYPNVEYLIIDGASTDKTLSIVRGMEDAFIRKGVQFRYYSEKDHGIYDAMNKGIHLATGKWINFMNSGDGFCSPDILLKTFQDDPEENVLYGDTIFQMSFGDILLKPKNIDCLRKHMVFCHQSVFLPTQEMKNYPFGLKYQIAGDYKFFYDYYNRGGGFRYLGYPVAYFESENGLSSSNALQAHKENAQIRSEHLHLTWQIKYQFKCFCFHFKEMLKEIFPKEIVEAVRAWNYRRKMRRRIYKQKLGQVKTELYDRHISAI
ncbi:MAG: glycosyltransferase family 2 protein [Bacteroidales bacterium]